MDANCGQANGSATVVVTGGTPNYTYAWQGLPGQTTATATGLAAGSYTVTVTDANDCSATLTLAVTNLGGPTITVGPITAFYLRQCQRFGFGNGSGWNGNIEFCVVSTDYGYGRISK